MNKENKLVGIVSYNIYSQHMNYGAVLHSFAFQQYLIKKGVDSVVLCYIPKKLNNYHLKYPILNVNRIKSLKGFIIFLVNWGIGFFSNLRKYKKFQRFFREKLRKTSLTYRFKDLMKLNSIENFEFTVFVCESDVIWKLYSENDFDECFFLKFPAAEGQKKVAYSPSLSSRKFTVAETKKFVSLVSDFIAISTREAQTAAYLSSILNHNVEWVLDPTLLLDKADYDKIAIVPKEDGYVLLYNCMIDDHRMIKEARKFASRRGIQLIEVSNFYINKFVYNHRTKTDIGIEEFLGYIKNADFVICNAFHGMCFSVIFKKQFFLFQRDESDYRMQNITEALGLQSRLISHTNKQIPSKYDDIDYEEVYANLEVHRKRSYDFIDENIVNI